MGIIKEEKEERESEKSLEGQKTPLFTTFNETTLSGALGKTFDTCYYTSVVVVVVALKRHSILVAKVALVRRAEVTVVLCSIVVYLYNRSRWPFLLRFGL